MLVKSLHLNEYRNYSNNYFEFDPNLNIIIGKNGIGKTNILESIIVVSNTKSFRTLNDIDLIKKDSEYLKIELESDEHNFKVVINQKQKSLYLDDKHVKKSSEYIGKLNAILFKPSDLQLFSDPPSERRKILDLEIGKINKQYLYAELKYNSLLKDKNKLLKELEIDKTLLDIINESMVPQIQIIINERTKFIDFINQYISDYYQKISNSNSKIKIIYKKCCEIDDIKNSLNNALTNDYYYHYATLGPHRENYYFLIDDDNLNNIASQGQKRMVLIAFKFALIKYIEEYTKVTPIILLDDIMSELDKDNQERLIDILPDNAQIIITTTDIDKINITKKYKLIELKEEKDV